MPAIPVADEPIWIAMSLNALLLVAIIAAPGDEVKLSPGLRKTADAVTQAYFHGDSFRVWRALSPAVARLKEPQLDKLNQGLAAREVRSNRSASI